MQRWGEKTFVRKKEVRPWGCRQGEAECTVHMHQVEVHCMVHMHQVEGERMVLIVHQVELECMVSIHQALGLIPRI